MAKRSIVHKPKKLEPAELTLNFRLPNNTGTPNSRQMIDISQVCSILNRRFYRQGLAWAVAGFTLHTSGVASQVGQLQIRKLPTTWTMSNSWEKGFRSWKRMIDDALEETSVKPRFLDFKIYSDKAHHANGFGENMLPFVRDETGAVQFATAGEWEPATFEIPDTNSAIGGVNSREVIAVGNNYPGAGASGLNAVSLIEGYANSRSLPAVTEPNAPDDADDTAGPLPQNWISATFNEGTLQSDEVLENLVTENNQAPYPFEGADDGTGTPFADTMYPGGGNQLMSLVLHDQLSVTTIGAPGSPAMSRRTATGGVFPCGLIQLSYNPALADSILQVHLVPGTHRGYMAKPMKDL